MHIKLNFSVLGLALLSLSAMAQETPKICPSEIVDEFIRTKVLDKEGLASLSGVKAPSGDAFIVGGVLTAAAGAVVSGAGGILFGAFLPSSKKLSEIDTLVLSLSKDKAASTKEAKEMMRKDVMEAAQLALGASSISVEASGNLMKHTMTGGFCSKGGCEIHAMAYKGTTLPVLHASGDYVLSSNFGSTQGGARLFEGNIERVSTLTRELDKRGYQTGFWSAGFKTIFSAGSPCGVLIKTEEKKDATSG
ncbi:hypothetical protein [Dechloromonas sp. ZS-1]|uniref:hypothetical protein n=1 Tax=Dechloromonas sp. ZS-1 TaxID=3138067 RepID=UPI0031FCCBC4